MSSTGVPKSKWNGALPDSVPGPGTGLALELAYAGKVARDQVLTAPPAALSAIWTGPDATANALYYGDNLPILSALRRDPRVCGKVKLIYIDPPFATNSVFQSRGVQNDAYHDLLVGAHYIEFLRQRLILLHELLADDGSIYIHLDENMAFYIKVIMDEVFGAKNFRNWITRKKCNPKNYTSKTYGNISDYLLFYSKSDSYIWNRPTDAWTAERALKEYTCVEEGTGRRYKKVPVHAPGTRNGETGQPWRGKLPPPGKHWQYPPSVLDEMDARGEIYWSANGNPRRKIYLDASTGVAVQDIWLDYRDVRNQNTRITGYPTEKNPQLLELIIRASSNPGDLVLDCFAGSGTTLDVASQLGRSWIGVDNSFEAMITMLNRFQHGTQPMGDFVEKPDPPNLQTSYLSPLPSGERETPKQIRDFTLFADRSLGENTARLDELVRKASQLNSHEKLGELADQVV